MSSLPQEEYADLRAAWAKNRPVLARRHPYMIAGVCRGLAVHLGGSVKWWRLCFLIFSFTLITPFLYIFFLFTLPHIAKNEEIPLQRRRLIPPLQENTKTSDQRIYVAILLLLAAVILSISFVDSWAYPRRITFPILLIVTGAGIAWTLPSAASRRDILFAAGGSAVAAIGGVLMVTAGSELSPVLAGLESGIAVVVVLALVLYPVGIRMERNLRQAAVEKSRADARADIAAHLHDSVLQTLALLRARADDAEAVRRLARTQEQELRSYLYADRKDSDTSAATELQKISQNLERQYGAEVETVISGDIVPTSAIQTALAAAREAITNACKYGGNMPISVYAEFGEQNCQIWVRDRGPGFDPADIPSDRAGIRDSLIGRMQRIGGEALVRSPLPSGGTEVYIGYRQGKPDLNAPEEEKSVPIADKQIKAE